MSQRDEYLCASTYKNVRASVNGRLTEGLTYNLLLDRSANGHPAFPRLPVLTSNTVSKCLSSGPQPWPSFTASYLKIDDWRHSLATCIDGEPIFKLHSRDRDETFWSRQCGANFPFIFINPELLEAPLHGFTPGIRIIFLLDRKNVKQISNSYRNAESATR